MTQDERKVIELALDALQMLHDENMDYLTRNKLGGENNQCMVFAREAITAIKEALAQPEQEPVAYLSNKRQRINIEIKPQTFVEIPTVTDWEMPLYMKPPQRIWVGLTDDEAQQVFKRHNCDISKDLAGILARAIETKLKEKNT